MRDCECTVYIDDLVLVAQPSNMASVWKQLEKLADFEDQSPGTWACITTCRTAATARTREGHRYFEAVVKKYMDETGVNSLPWVATPSSDDRIHGESQQPGQQSAMAASHLMSIMYIARLCRAEV